MVLILFSVQYIVFTIHFHTNPSGRNNYSWTRNDDLPCLQKSLQVIVLKSQWTPIQRDCGTRVRRTLSYHTLKTFQTELFYYNNNKFVSCLVCQGKWIYTSKMFGITFRSNPLCWCAFFTSVSFEQIGPCFICVHGHQSKRKLSERYHEET